MYADHELAAPPDGWTTCAHDYRPRPLTPRIAASLRMLADWQIVDRGYDPADVTRLCEQMDSRQK